MTSKGDAREGGDTYTSHLAFNFINGRLCFNVEVMKLCWMNLKYLKACFLE